MGHHQCSQKAPTPVAALASGPEHPEKEESQCRQPGCPSDARSLTMALAPGARDRRLRVFALLTGITSFLVLRLALLTTA
jgi:hypothetical protein